MPPALFADTGLACPSGTHKLYQDGRTGRPVCLDEGCQFHWQGPYSVLTR